jgi:hypothetical protein
MRRRLYEDWGITYVINNATFKIKASDKMAVADLVAKNTWAAVKGIE